jgi:hypothetical protein
MGSHSGKLIRVPRVLKIRSARFSWAFFFQLSERSPFGESESVDAYLASKDAEQSNEKMRLKCFEGESLVFSVGSMQKKTCPPKAKHADWTFQEM